MKPDWHDRPTDPGLWVVHAKVTHHLMDQVTRFVAHFKYHTFPGTTLTSCCATCLNGRYIVGSFDSGPDVNQAERERNARRACLKQVDAYMKTLVRAYRLD